MRYPYDWNFVFGYGDTQTEDNSYELAIIVRDVVNTIILAIIFFILLVFA